MHIQGQKFGERLEEVKYKDLKNNIEAQLSSSILLSKIFFDYFKKHKGGNIIFFHLYMS